ncbi:uncharacterized protein LOC117782911 [Drosophila innubila]|uniref:uncharacterized protein LOC117782911 n=1 Tax=Drosophila innubila TaxID=198719 RepID=UPI00148D8747|nr:uncharacterized protein LOC117782911 [Drosophila innubila]
MRAVLFPSYYILVLVLYSRCPHTSAWRSFKIILKQFDYEANAKLVDVKILVQNNSESSSLSVTINVLETLNDVDMTAGIALQTEQANFTNLLTKNLNFCKMLKERNGDPLIRLIYQDLLKHGKWFKECPIQKGIYSLQDYRVDEELLPSFLAETNFKFSIRLNKPKGEQIFQGVIFGRIDKSKGFNNLKMFSLG